jgi:hypothetical protein
MSKDTIEYSREILEEKCKVVARINPEDLSLSLDPAVSMYDQHHGKRRAASVFLEIAAKYAEKCDGKILQLSNVGLCIVDGIRVRELAQYPNQPLDFSLLCQGWQEVFTSLEE